MMTIKCEICDGEWFVSSPPYSHGLTLLSHYCNNGVRYSKAADMFGDQSEEAQAMGEASKALSKANAEKVKNLDVEFWKNKAERLGRENKELKKTVKEFQDLTLRRFGR